MGAELVLTYNGEDVANIGRTHRYHSSILLDLEDDDFAHEQLNKKLNKARVNFLTRFADECYSLEELLDMFEDDCVRVGRTQAILESIDEYGDLKIMLSV